MNIKAIIVLIVLTAILTVSIVAAYENVEHNSHADGGISDVSSSHDVRHKLHNGYVDSNNSNKNYGAESPQDLIVQGYLYDFDII